MGGYRIQNQHGKLLGSGKQDSGLLAVSLQVGCKLFPMLKAAFTLVFTVCFLGCSLFAQDHDYVWLTGYQSFSSDSNLGGTVIDFNEYPPIIYREDRDLNIDATMASYCDSSGVLQLYTNGIKIVGASGQILENGDSLNLGIYANINYNGGYRLAQSEFFLELPTRSDTIFLLHESTDFHPVTGIAITYLNVSKIKVDGDNENSIVYSKNEVLLHEPDRALGFLTAAKHANGKDWWIFICIKGQNKYFRFILSPEGISQGQEIELTPTMSNILSEGILVFSPDGTKFARYEATYGIYFYDFDRCTGEFSNPKYISMAGAPLGGGLSFSPDSRYLYATSATEVFQIDTWASNMNASKKTVAQYDGYQSPFGSTFFLSQLAPDGRIYLNCTNGENVLHAIQSPNKPGLSCDVRQHSVQLPTYNAFTMPHYPNYRLGPLDGSPCDTLGLDNHPVAKFRYDQDTTDYLTVEFTDLSTYEPTDWSWDFGDPNGASGNTSSEPSPVHTFPSDGTYEVCLTVSNQYDSSSFCRTLVIGTGVSASGEEVPAASLSVFPNPARAATNFILSDYLPQHAVLTLHTATGQVALTQRIGFGWNSVPLEGPNGASIAPGLYFYEVKDSARPQGGKLLGSGKLVVAR